MTSITDSISNTIGGVPVATKPAGSMDQNDFLKLMTTQLTTQDPFNPVDNTQMVAQMAQFSQVAGISEINSSLKALVANLAGGRLNDAASWIGKSVLVAADSIGPAADGSYAGEIAIPSDATDVEINLTDATGKVVHTQTFGATKAGTLPFAWDGKADGEAVAGPLKISVQAKGKDGLIETTSAAWTRVNAIQSPASGGASQFITGLGVITAEDALRLA